MRRTAILSLLLAAPVLLAAQAPIDNSVGHEQLALRELSEARRMNLMPNEVVGFRILGASGATRTLRVSTGHLVGGHLYRALAYVTPRDGSSPLRAEGTLSADSPFLSLGQLPAGSYSIIMHLDDLSTGSTRDAKNNVVLR